MRAAGLFCLLWLAAWPARAEPDPPYDANKKPLTRAHARLLEEAGYRTAEDGSVRAAESAAALSELEVSSVVQRLESAKRLKALLRLHILFTKSAGPKYLTPAEREEVRALVRENWAYFPLSTRRDFRVYFSVRELEELNRDPAPTDTGPVVKDMKDPEIDFSARVQHYLAHYQSAPPPPVRALPTPRLAPPAISPPPLPSAPAAARATAPVPPAMPLGVAVPVTPEVLQALALAPRPPAPPAPAAPPPPPAAPPAPVTAPAPPAAEPAFAAEPAPPAAAETSAAAGMAPVPFATIAAPPPAPPPPAPAAPPPPPAPVTAEALERFLAEAPYGREAKALLRLIAEKASGGPRDRALSAAVELMPHIVVDSARSGLDARAALLAQESSAGRSYTIALSPGPALWTRKRFLGSRSLMLADSPKAYAGLHLGVPGIEALRKDAVALKQEPGPWGLTRVYSDDSRRGSYSPQQQAGVLLRKLLRLDARRSGWDASLYAAELYARTAEMIFYARLAVELGDDGFLDPEMRLSFRQWLDHPEEWRDFLVHTLSASRVQLLDPRRGGPREQERFNRQAAANCPAAASADEAWRLAAEKDALKKDIDALANAGLVEAAAAGAARQAVDAEFAARPPAALSAADCRARFDAEAPGLRHAGVLLTELNTVELRFREERGYGAAR